MTQVQKVKNIIQARFPRIGVNKKRELSRLVYEIVKRDKVSAKDILPVLQLPHEET